MHEVMRHDEADGFARSREAFEHAAGFLDGAQAASLTHAELENWLSVDGREVLRLLLQDHLALRAMREQRIESVVDTAGVTRSIAEAGHARALETVVGQVSVARIAYRKPGVANLHPADGILNLPAERHSHGLRRLAAIEASRDSFDEATAALERATGCQLGKRQVEELAQRSVVDFEDFYATRKPPVASDASDTLVISLDGKGIVMRTDALRPGTAAAAAKATPKLATRLSGGEKPNRKRMAELGTVYDSSPILRSAADIMPASAAERSAARDGPVAANKWLTASVVDDAAAVVGKVFDEAERRDPAHARRWVALVDGAKHQLDCIEAEAAARQVKVTIVCDFIHVLEYLWKAAWCFFPAGDRAAEAWVQDKARAVLGGGATKVAGAIRRTATNRHLAKPERKGADKCASYLTNKARYLDYPTALGNGWPIATGVIEGACRHLVKDRLDVTGARWGLQGAETILKLRALRSNGDFDQYWGYHLTHDQQRIHSSRYADNVIPRAA
ncbi:MAG: ISKra4 family transposase [Acidimicrobiales bacterium]